MKKNLVMGVAKGYDWDALEPFVLSCKQNCPNAELVLFVDDISDFTRNQLVRGGVFLFDVPAEYKNVLIINTRWKMYYDFLNTHSDNYAHIFVTDVRDVIFQGDVFEQFKDRTNYLGYTTEADDIGGSKTGNLCNYAWILSFFGKEEADKLLDKKIICAGTVIGTFNEMKIFCRELWNTLKQNTSFIADQAVTNYLVWNNLLPIENLIEIDVESGEVLTLALKHDFSVSDDKILRNGGIPAVVHQYDRHESLVQLVNEVYRDKNFQVDERFTDTRSVIEQTKSLLRADRIGEASGGFLKKFLAPDDFSIYGIALMKLWEMILEKLLSQPLKLLELAVQYALISVRNLSDYFFMALCNNVKRAKEIVHPVDPEFKNYVLNVLFTVANNCLRSNQPENCFWCIKEIEELDMPLDKNFYLFVADANRIFGKKDEALAAYKRALELS